MENLPHSVELVRDGESIAFRYIDERLLPDELRIEQTGDWMEVVEAIGRVKTDGRDRPLEDVTIKKIIITE